MIVGTVLQTEISCRPGAADQEREKATAHGHR